MKKRLFVLALVLILACTLLSVSASAAEIIASGKHDGGPVTWTLTSDGVLTISGNYRMQGKNNPDDYEWASYADQITKVVIEDGITNIASGAFFEYSNLESVYIGNTVTIIDDQAFAFCSKWRSPAMRSGPYDNVFRRKNHFLIAMGKCSRSGNQGKIRTRSFRQTA
jgi:hypothetical protein